jgi:hypothetical protein
MADPGDKEQPRPRGLAGTIWLLEHAQDYVAAVVGAFVAGLIAVNWFEKSPDGPGGS